MKNEQKTAEIERTDRYGSFEMGEGDVVIYDRQNPTAWLQSDTTESLQP